MLTEQHYNELVDNAARIMASIPDPEHNDSHMRDTVKYTEQLMSTLPNDISEQIDETICLVAAYWHDTGRSIAAKGHEAISADMLREKILSPGYPEDYAAKFDAAIRYHKWSMTPSTLEGWVVRDADKLGWLGVERWTECLNSDVELTRIIELLPRLRNEFLHFPQSRDIYDADIPKLIELLKDHQATELANTLTEKLFS